jgi:SpoVK/Ycf46/Vps4 family AAA+-type ATPase
MDSDVNLEEVASHCPKTLTGADFYAVCADAMLRAMGRRIEQVTAEWKGDWDLKERIRKGNIPGLILAFFFLIWGTQRGERKGKACHDTFLD